MPYEVMHMEARKRIALIAHDNCKTALLEWARFNRGTLSGHELCATGTTGTLLADELGIAVHCDLSGPLALLRVAVVHNIPVACNRATADFLLSSPLMSEPYPRIVQGYVERSRGTQGRVVGGIGAG